MELGVKTGNYMGHTKWLTSTGLGENVIGSPPGVPKRRAAEFHLSKVGFAKSVGGD